MVAGLLDRADAVALLGIDFFAGDRLDELVAAHPDVAVEMPDREDEAMLAEPRYQASAC